MKTPQVVIVLVNWNGLTDTLACLASLEKVDYPNYQTIVIDNGSSDDSVEQIRIHYPKVTLFETGENLGFVGGNNIAMQHPLVAKTDYVLLLNNDTEVAPDFLSLLVEVAQSDKKIGIVGPTIYYFDEPKTIWSAGGGIDWDKGMTHMVNLNELDEGQLGDTPRSMYFVTGCALLIKRSVIKEVGLLDPRFFAYYEEAEWCVRTTQAGFKILHVPSARIWHKISIVAREASPQVHYYMVRNRLLFLNLTQAKLSVMLSVLGRNLMTLISWSIKPKWRHKAPQRKAMWQAILDYMRGRFGRVDIS
ncbi:glycosyltransferase family 2 protein [Anaerolineales bacterium HSG24]|nr:glycosyltransferase family 2 protein [Anaerolineales bacterium HSG24]